MNKRLRTLGIGTAMLLSLVGVSMADDVSASTSGENSQPILVAPKLQTVTAMDEGKRESLKQDGVIRMFSGDRQGGALIMKKELEKIRKEPNRFQYNKKIISSGNNENLSGENQLGREIQPRGETKKLPIISSVVRKSIETKLDKIPVETREAVLSGLVQKIDSVIATVQNNTNTGNQKHLQILQELREIIIQKLKSSENDSTATDIINSILK